MRVVIDTNVLIATLSKISPYRLIINKLLLQEFEMVVSTEILLEYEEIITQKSSAVVAYNFLEFLLQQSTIIRIEPPYHWYLIKSDLDDNKFVDVALIANVDYIVTNDRHFNVLKTTPFPKVQVISLDEFMEVLNNI
jgi:uncharacterized protein